jgi:hypothetical protein
LAPQRQIRNARNQGRVVFGRLAQQIAKRHFTYYGAGRSSDVRFGKKHITLQNPGGAANGEGAVPKRPTSRDTHDLPPSSEC